jgi:hypothetical protein
VQKFGLKSKLEAAHCRCQMELVGRRLKVQAGRAKRLLAGFTPFHVSPHEAMRGRPVSAVPLCVDVLEDGAPHREWNAILLRDGSR